MVDHLHRTRHTSRRSERGQALLLLLVVVGLATGAVLLSFYNSTKITLDSDQKTADALAAAKAALIGYALRGRDGATNPQRPGEFPCPDTNNDGFDGGTCVAGRLGRIPWKTLGIPELKDSAGETLWYAIAGPFRSFNGGALNSSPINSDTRGNITVFAADGVTPLTTQAVAVIFAPGQALGAQNRDAATTAFCQTTSTTIAQNLCAANYLETSAGINNATTNGPFITGLRSPTYNDRVISITTPEFIPLVEQRVASELRTMIQAYYHTNGYFPFAANYDDTTGSCVNNQRRGRVPKVILPNCAGLVEWTGSLPNWFKNNNWWQMMYYSVAAGYAYTGPGNCTGGCLTVGSNTSVPALFFTPGTPANNAWRTATLDTILSHYLEDPANQDGWGAGANDTYVIPASTRFDRDRIFVLAGSECASNAAALLALAPCGQNPQCAIYSNNLAACGCSAASIAMITPPCQNTLQPSACQAAAAALKTCNS